MEAEAFKDAAEQLCRPGSDGRVWINRWAERFGELGSQREFFERSSDLFNVLPGEGRRYTVELTQEGIEKAATAGGGSGHAQPKPWAAKAPSRSGAPKAFAKKETANGGCNVPKSAPSAHGKGTKGGQKGSMACATWKGGQTGGSTWGSNWKGGTTGKNTWGTSMGGKTGGATWLALPASPSWNTGNSNGKGWGKASFSAPQKDAGSTALAAIREIEVQLRSPQEGREGHVWLEGWGQRYQWALGSLREFLDSRPDKFVVIPGHGRKYTVAFANRGSTAKGVSTAKGGCKGVKRPAVKAPAVKAPPWRGESAPAAKRIKTEQSLDGSAKLKAKIEQVEEEAAADVQDSSTDDLFAEAIDEVARQLEEAGGEGNVWIQDWGRRFQKKLGTLREFLEKHSDTFEVIPGQGKKFTVKIL